MIRFKEFMLLAGLVALLLMPSASSAALWQNTDIPGVITPDPPLSGWVSSIDFSNTTPGTAGGGTTVLAAILTANMVPNPLNDLPTFQGGQVTSKVFYLAGSDASQGLGFVYQWHFPTGYAGAIMTRSTFNDAEWNGVNISAAGWTGGTSGWSTPLDTILYTGWDDGDPATVYRQDSAHAPEVNWITLVSDGYVGTEIGYPATPPERSSHVWFECPDVRSWTVGGVDVIDGNKSASVPVLVTPVPGALTLGAIGLLSIAALRSRRRKKA